MKRYVALALFVVMVVPVTLFSDEGNDRLGFGTEILKCKTIRTLLKVDYPKKEVSVIERIKLQPDRRGSTVVKEHSASVITKTKDSQFLTDLRCQGDPFENLRCSDDHQSRPAGFRTTFETTWLHGRYLLGELIEARDLAPAMTTILACEKTIL